MKTVIAMAYENANQELVSCKGIYHPEDEEEMLDVLAVSFATGYEKAFEWIKYEDEVPPEGVMLIFKLTKKVEDPKYYVGWAEGERIVFEDGSRIWKTMCLFYGLEWRLLEFNQ